LLHAVAQYSYFQGGGYFIKGGSGKLSNYLADVIRKNGGEVITKATVKKISKNRVYFRDSYKEADFIVSNISPEDTYRLMNIDFIEKREIGSSLLTTYIGFSKNLKEIYGERAYSKFLSDFVFVDYSQIESGLTTSEKSFGVICKIDNLENWGSEYKMEKKELEKRLISELEKEYPEIGKYIEYIETGTAKTVQRYIKTPNGTAYGFKPTPSQFFKIPKSKSKKVKNLFFVGQWVIAGGFAPAISSGYLCYKELKSSHN
jgi:phytoene dehydrogenase-like protein